jgi:transcriptional regulator with XRE-family HTH domain
LTIVGNCDNQYVTMKNGENSSTRDFGRWLRREIEGREMSQGAFAEKAGLSREHLNRILHNANTPRGVTIVRIARALGVSREKVESHLPPAVAA